MSTVEKTLAYINERRENVIKGNINCIPLPFRRFRSELPGIEQKKYYLITGATKAAKTQIANYIIVFNAILYAYYNPNKVTTKIFYYNFEEDSANITLRFMCYLLLIIYNIRIDPTNLSSTNEEYPADPEIIGLLQKGECKKILDFYNEYVVYLGNSNPTGVWKHMKRYADENGTTHKKKYTYKDELGMIVEGESFSHYEPNNPKEYVFIIVDHVSLIDTEKGLTLRESIAKLSEYLIILRNRYKYIPVVIQQQSTETTSLEAFKSNKIRPTKAGLADCKNTGNDCDVLIGITNPFSFELPEYLGYDIKKLKDSFRCIEVVLNRGGRSNGICPLFFDGATNNFKELPLPNDSSMQEVYAYINRLNEKKAVGVSLLIVTLNKLKKKLQNWKDNTNFAKLKQT